VDLWRYDLPSSGPKPRWGVKCKSPALMAGSL
jgi:hypothetical protein